MTPAAPPSEQWRDPGDIAAQWLGHPPTSAAMFKAVVRGRFWEALENSGLTLLVTREYEHLLLALDTDETGPEVSYLPLPHPSGIAVDRVRHEVVVASTRNPNQIYRLRPVSRTLERLDVKGAGPRARTLVPTRVDFYPGCLYLHDIAFVDGRLYGSAAGQNAIVELRGNGEAAAAWWPRSVERRRQPVTTANFLQLNSIAAGDSLATSFFTASAAQPGSRRPGQRHFPVDGRGVVFSGASREPAATGLTRPHSARLHRGRVWVLNSGYGEFGYVARGRFEAVCRLPGWTRGLDFTGRIAIVGTSRILPRFTAYAPGLNPAQAVCGLHAVDLDSGAVLGSLIWPAGDQIFAIQGVPAAIGRALPFIRGRRRASPTHRRLFYGFQPDPVPSTQRPR